MLEDTEKCPTPKNKGNGFELVWHTSQTFLSSSDNDSAAKAIKAFCLLIFLCKS